ncbi:hypothetical protein ACLOJK_037023 [Asimina triloba]
MLLCPSFLFFRLPAPVPPARPHPCPQRRPPLPLPALLPRRRRPHSTPPVVVIVRTPAAIVRTPAAIGDLLPSSLSPPVVVSSRRRLPLVLVADLLPDSRWCGLPRRFSPSPPPSLISPASLLPSLSPPVVATLSSSRPRRRSSRRFSRRLPLVLPCLASPDSSPLPTVVPLLSAVAATPLRQQLHLHPSPCSGFLQSCRFRF